MTAPTPPPIFDAAELRAKALAATPGPWLCCGSSRLAPCPCGLVWSNGPEALHVLTVASETRTSEVPTPNTKQAAANVLFIVAANPAAVLALLDERATLLARVEAAEAEFAQVRVGAPGRIAHVLDDTRGYHVESLDDDLRAEFLHRLTRAAFDPTRPTSWNPVPSEKP